MKERLKVRIWKVTSSLGKDVRVEVGVRISNKKRSDSNGEEKLK